MMDAFVVITREEGAKALFKGGVARVIRSSPQCVAPHSLNLNHSLEY
jgi:hypothetical protein